MIRIFNTTITICFLFLAGYALHIHAEYGKAELQVLEARIHEKTLLDRYAGE